MTNSSTAVINIKALLDPSDVKVKVQEIQNAFSKIKMPANLATSLNSTVTSLSKAISDYETKLNKGIKTTTDAKGINASVDEIIKGFTNLSNVATKVKAELGKSVDLSSMIKLDDNTLNKINQLKNDIAALEKQAQETASKAGASLNSIFSQLKGKGATSAATHAIEVFNTGNIKEAIQLLEEAKQRQEAVANSGLNSGAKATASANVEVFNELIRVMTNAQNSSSSLFSEIETKSSELASTIKGATDEAVSGLGKAGEEATKYGQKIGEIAPKIQELTSSQAQFVKEVDQVKSRIQYFFGLSNAINLVKRAIRGAVDTIKDLDKAMTETAVVTDFTVSDMWKQLPEYTKRANELGVTTQQAYESATLFYQQGLNTQQAAALSVETLKMARIAGLDAAEATDRMTNALRGFNMELNAQSAQRIDDVYSELAARSASNVDEISTAMTKVASLAHSANMEFETTAAFLAQIIETTRESAETAGTALKTVVARFSEVKKLYGEDQLKGTDEEGQAIDVNKISTALRTAGIDLNKYFLGEVGLDDIFMELASKWDTLSSVQQRYIATQAAGSRQQSRFIALMQDYARTQELVSMAYDANGASAKQFEKTQESLQSKLARLKNAWNEFLMGLANSSLVKGVVDVLTNLLNLVNKLTSAFGNGVGTILKWGAALGGLVSLRAMFSNGGIATKAIAGLFSNTPIGNALGKTFGLGGEGSTFTAAAIEGGAAVKAGGAEAAAALVAGATEAASIETAAATEKAAIETATASEKAAIEVAGETEGAAIEVAGEAKGAASNILQTNLTNQAALAQAQHWNLMRSSQWAGNSSSYGMLLSHNATVGGGLPIGDAVYTGARTGNTGLLGMFAAAGRPSGLLSGITALLPVLGAVAAAVGVVAVAYKEWLRLTPEGQLKTAEDLADVTSKVANNTEKTVSAAKNAQTSYADLNNAINNANTSSEYNEAIQNRTNYVLEQIKNNPSLAQYAKYNSVNGELQVTFDEDGLNKFVEASANLAKFSSFAADLGSANLQAQSLFTQERNLQRAEREAAWKGRTNPEAQAEVAAARAQLQTAQQGVRDTLIGAYTKTLSSSGLEDEVTDQLAKFLADNFDEDVYQEEINSQRSYNWWHGGGSKKDLQAQYKSLYGVDADATMERKDLAEAVAAAKIDKSRMSQANELAELIKKDNEGIYSEILAAYNGVGGNALNLANVDIEDALWRSEQKALYGEDFEFETEGVSADDLIQQLFPNLSNGEIENVLQNFGDTVGKSADEVKKQVLQQTKQNQISKKSKLFETALNSNITDTSVYQKIGQMTPQMAEMVSNIVTKATDLLSSQDVGEFLPELVNLQDEESLKQIQNFASSFNLDNPIQAFQKLKDAEKEAAVTGNTVFANMLDKIEATNASVFDTGHLVQSFFVSSSYDALSDSISDFIDKNKKITADNIEELAESCEDLKILLEQDKINAQGLATALTALELGKVSIDTITTSLLEAWSAGKDFETVIAEVKKWIDEFDEGTDLQTGTDHIQSELEDLSEYVKNWEFGNEPTENIWNHIFGADTYDAYLKSFNGDFEKAEAAMTKRINQVSKWTENNGLGALQYGETHGIDYLKSKTDKNGNIIEFTWDVGQYESTEAAIKDVADALQISEGAAESFILEWQTAMPTLRDEWNQLSHDTQVNNFAKNITEGTVVSQQELDALGITIDEIQAALDKLGKGAEIPIVVNWQDEETKTGLTGDKLINHFNETIGAQTKTTVGGGYYDGSQFVKQDRTYTDYSKFLSDNDISTVINTMQGKINGIDFTQLHNKLVEAYKLSDSQATEVAENIAHEMDKNFVQEIEITEFNPDTGAFETTSALIEADTKEALEAGIKAAEEAADAKLLAAQLAKEDFVDVTQSLTSAITNAGEAGATSAASSLESKINNGSYKITVQATVLGLPDGSTATGGWANRAKGGIVGSYAKGSENFHVQPGTALTGEEGPELIWNKEGGYSYLTGENGPEFQNLKPGDRVFNAQETKKILHNSAARGGIFGSYATGAWKVDKDAGGKGSGNGGGSSDKDEDNEWKNEIDWLYNVVQNIEELERQQNILQEEYNDLLTDQTKTGQDLYKMLIQQLGNLYAQLDHQTYALEKREQEMREFMDTTNDMDDYLWYNWNDRTIEIDWDKIDQITDEEQYNHVKELIDQAEDIQDKMDDAEDAIIDVNNAIQDLENIWRDTFIDFEDRVLKAVIKMYQTVIDNYSELNDTLNDSNSAILDAINKEISLQRQIRDNTKTEEEIANDEAQLAYLRRDTSGGNDLAALQLERELNDQRQNYEDNLVDQAVQRLQDDNDAAAAQREKQIEIMQAQLDYQSENGEFNAYVRELLETAMDGDGHLATDSDLYSLLSKQENLDAMTDVQKEVWEEELNTTFNQVMAELLKRQGEAEGTYFTAVTAAFQGVQDQFDKFYHGSYSQGTAHGGSGSGSSGSGGGSGSGKGSTGGKGNDDPPKNPPSVNIFTVDQKNNSMTVSTGGNLTKQEAKALTDRLNKQRILKYATGGLNTETGLAWLDGTAKAPEYVLNAKQTDAFLRLADVLPAAMNNTSSSVSNTFGSTTNNIVINVDKIESDYSVDQMVDRVKEKLFETGSYRNNNVLNFLR